MIYTYAAILFSILPLFLISVLGGYFRYRGWYEKNADKTISWLLVHFFLPLLIFDAIVSNKHIETFTELLRAAALGFFVTSMGFIIARYVCHSWLQNMRSGIFAIASGLFNYGFLPIPIILIFSSLEVLATLFLFNIGVEIAIWTVGMYILYSHTDKDHARFEWRRLLSPPLTSALLSLLFYAPLQALYSFPGVEKTIHMASQATIPMALLLLGALVYEHVPSLNVLQLRKRELKAAVLIKMAILPAMFFITGAALGIQGDLRTVLFIQAVMPSAVLPIVLAERVGYDTDLAVGIILVTNVIAIFTMPIFIAALF